MKKIFTGIILTAVLVCFSLGSSLASSTSTIQMSYFQEAFKGYIEEAQENKISSNYTQEEIDLLNKIVYAESRGESDEGQMAVANVVLNRVASPLFPDTIKEVIYQSGQFCPVKSGSFSSITPSQDVIDNVEKVLLGEMAVSEDVLFFKVAKSNSNWGSHDFYTRIGNHGFYTR